MSRRTELLLALAFVAVAWTECSVHSPVHHWATDATEAAYLALYRWTARPPCDPCDMKSATVGGVKIEYPAVLMRLPKLERFASDIPSVVVGARYFHISFSVSTSRPGTSQPGRERLLAGLRKNHTERELNGWKVFETSGDVGHLNATLVGERKRVWVFTYLDDRVRGSSLASWLNQTFHSAVESICAQNAADVAGSSRPSETPAASAPAP